jgi:hypothetical protein
MQRTLVQHARAGFSFLLAWLLLNIFFFSIHSRSQQLIVGAPRARGLLASLGTARHE